jgi:hypothetical protein
VQPTHAAHISQADEVGDGGGGRGDDDRRPAPGSDAPAINIFAPLPAAHARVAHRLLRETGSDAERQPRTRRIGHAPAEHLEEDAEDDGGVGHAPHSSRRQGIADRAPADDPATVGNRVAAMVTRYQSSRALSSTAEAQHGQPEISLSPVELAERAGSTEVTDLLAASAAWLTLAQGHTRFTRREVMEVFENLPGEHPRTLEARIKGFGQLVRSGTLVLADQGLFAISERELDRYRRLIAQG